jgi:hypothetical protein
MTIYLAPAAAATTIAMYSVLPRQSVAFNGKKARGIFGQLGIKAVDVTL